MCGQPTDNDASRCFAIFLPVPGGLIMLNRIWIDVEDLFVYAAYGLRPSGFLRLEFELCRALVALPESRGRVLFVRHDAKRKCLATVPWQEVDALYDLISNGSKAYPDSQLPPLRQRWRKIYRGLPRPIQVLVSALVSQAKRSQLRRAQSKASNHFANAASGEILMCLGAPWVTPEYFSYIQKAAREKRLRFAVLIHDIIPLRRPEWVDFKHSRSFRELFANIVSLADMIFTNSAATAKDVACYAHEKELSLRSVPIPIPLGTGFKTTAEKRCSTNPDASNRLPRPNSYALIVSTIEPRKNHGLLFAVWRRLLEDMPAAIVPTLVFAGRTGWLISDFMQLLKNCNFLDGKVVHIENPTDEELEALYDGCLFTLFPSFYEGWGLPVTESLAFGRPCIISNATSLPEAGGSLARYVDPYDATGAYRVIRETIEDRAGLWAWRDRVQREFKPVEWSESARAVLTALDASTSAARLSPTAEQRRASASP
jgi:glycosyltransferase involved in cell wall biosynthesis